MLENLTRSFNRSLNRSLLIFVVAALLGAAQLPAQQGNKKAGRQKGKAKSKSVELTGQAIASESADVIWHRQPAKKWNEAFPFGNGRLGGMMFGRVGNERIQLNEDSLWSGAPGDYYKPNGPKVLAQARELIFDDKYGEAEKLILNKFLARDRLEERTRIKRWAI